MPTASGHFSTPGSVATGLGKRPGRQRRKLASRGRALGEVERGSPRRRPADEFRTPPRSEHLMTTQIDLKPAAQRIAQLVAAVPDDALTRPTPCERYTVGDLLDHIGGFALAFGAAAVKRPLEG